MAFDQCNRTVFWSIAKNISCPQDPAIATSKRVGGAPYESYDRGTAKGAWVYESDGKTPLVGEVSYDLYMFK